MKFVISYSFGKDSTLALHRMIEQGHTPVGLLVMVNSQQDRSWFHGVDRMLMEQIGQALRLPLLLCETDGSRYHLELEQGLERAMGLGAKACVFGDIDMEDNARWCAERCAHKEMRSIFPLWKQSREGLVREVITLGYTAHLKCIRNDLLPEWMLGKRLDWPILEEMERRRVDPCGESGEYHTLVTGGPIFHQPVPVRCGRILQFDSISAVDITWDPQV